jgi:hypothetical protein
MSVRFGGCGFGTLAGRACCPCPVVEAFIQAPDVSKIARAMLLFLSAYWIDLTLIQLTKKIKNRLC